MASRKSSPRCWLPGLSAATDLWASDLGNVALWLTVNRPGKPGRWPVGQSPSGAVVIRSSISSSLAFTHPRRGRITGDRPYLHRAIRANLDWLVKNKKAHYDHPYYRPPQIQPGYRTRTRSRRVGKL